MPKKLDQSDFKHVTGLSAPGVEPDWLIEPTTGNMQVLVDAHNELVDEVALIRNTQPAPSPADSPHTWKTLFEWVAEHAVLISRNSNPPRDTYITWIVERKGADPYTKCTPGTGFLDCVLRAMAEEEDLHAPR